MRHAILLIMLLAMLPFSAYAQTEKTNNIANSNEEAKIPSTNMPIEIVDSLAENPNDKIILSGLPLRWLGGFYWGLHEGLNVTLGASVFGEFGKGARRGAGFSEQVALLYAHHFALKGGDVIYRDGGRKGFNFLGGAYFNNVDYAHYNSREAGLYGELSYRFDEHWEAAIYGQKSFIDGNRLMSPSMYDMQRLGDRIGASVRYNFSPSFSMQLSVEASKRQGPPVPAAPLENNNMMK